MNAREAASWFWNPVRERGIARLSLDEPSLLDEWEDLLAEEPDRLQDVYRAADTPHERFLILNFVDFGAPILETGGAHAAQLVDWFTRLDIGDPDLQARYLAHILEIGGREWNPIPITSLRFDITDAHVGRFITHTQQRVDASRSPITDADPYSPDLPAAEIILVEHALRTDETRVWRALQRLAPAELYRSLRDSHDPGRAETQSLLGPTIPEPGGALRNLWRAARTDGPDQVALLPGWWIVRDRLRTEWDWLRPFYQLATTPAERSWALQAAGYGAAVLNRPRTAGPNPDAPERFRRWLGHLHIGEPALQARARAWMLWHNNQLWTRWPLTSTWFDITGDDCAAYAAWFTTHCDTRRIDLPIRPHDSLPTPGIRLVDLALSEERNDIWDNVTRHLTPHHTNRLAEAIYTATTRPSPRL